MQSAMGAYSKQQFVWGRTQKFSW